LPSLPPGGTAFCAVSGGVDSVVLLHGLAKVAAGRRLVVLHYNHALRGKQSDLDESFVQKLSLELGLEFRSEKAQWKKEKPSQDTCRKKRYTFFKKEMTPKDRIFLAHHQDDQAETVLLRIFRGTGLKGLAAMREMDGPILRPLLNFRKKEILSWAKTAKIRWREDASNLKADYERNWLRLKIIKPLERRRGKVVEKIAALALEAQAAHQERVEFKPECMELDSGKLFLAGDFSKLGNLVSFFGLHRKHGEEILKILKKGQGEFSFQDRQILVSAGFLYWGKPIPSPQKIKKEKKYYFRSLLGEWESSDPFGEYSGEKAKKAYQKNGIPLFLRPQIPLVLVAGKLRIATDPRAQKKILLKSLTTKALEWLLEHHA